jgi:hypothetical protein
MAEGQQVVAIIVRKLRDYPDSNILLGWDHVIRAMLGH